MLHDTDWLKISLGALVLILIVLGLAECTFAGRTTREYSTIREKEYVYRGYNSEGTRESDDWYFLVQVEDGGEIVKVSVSEWDYYHFLEGEKVWLTRRIGRLTGICYFATVQKS